MNERLAGIQPVMSDAFYLVLYEISILGIVVVSWQTFNPNSRIYTYFLKYDQKQELHRKKNPTSIKRHASSSPETESWHFRQWSHHIHEAWDFEVCQVGGQRNVETIRDCIRWIFLCFVYTLHQQISYQMLKMDIKHQCMLAGNSRGSSLAL